MIFDAIGYHLDGRDRRAPAFHPPPRGSRPTSIPCGCLPMPSICGHLPSPRITRLGTSLIASLITSLITSFATIALLEKHVVHLLAHRIQRCLIRSLLNTQRRDQALFIDPRPVRLGDQREGSTHQLRRPPPVLPRPVCARIEPSAHHAPSRALATVRAPKRLILALHARSVAATPRIVLLERVSDNLFQFQAPELDAHIPWAHLEWVRVRARE